MSETTGAAKVHEAYSFACMRCGHGWEQSYEIEHHTDPAGGDFVVYKADGKRVPSPLSSPTCANCGGHVVRIMRAGRVSTVRTLMGLGEKDGDSPVSAVSPAGPVAPVTPPAASAPEPAEGGSTEAGSAEGGATADGSTMDREAEAKRAEGAEGAPEDGHWHLSHLLHPFHHRK
ncbi:hypothetical protein ACFYOP_07710 [Streptomyces sp. NPDC006294]|uniref:hypothetical protein n=1 Tax=Streptomyces sp. NPDC006294 TaxID=3364743 RepID=UPI0036C67DAB